MPSYSTIEVDVIAAPSHKDAVLVRYENEEAWIPRSLISDGWDLDEDDVGETVELEIATWKLEKDLGWL